MFFDPFRHLAVQYVVCIYWCPTFSGHQFIDFFRSVEVQPRLLQLWIFHSPSTYKIVFNLVSEAANDMFTLTSTSYSTRTRGHPYKLYLHNCSIDVRKHLLCERMVIIRINLPATSNTFLVGCFSFKCFIHSVELTSHVYIIKIVNIL